MTTDIQNGFYTLEKTFPLTMLGKDPDYAIKPAYLLDLMQETASRNIKNTPFGNVELNNEGLGWFLVRYRIEFDKYPINLEEITIKTENRGTMRQTAYRDFEVRTCDGERLLRATTSWLMVDLKTKSLVNIEQKFPEIIKFQKREDDLQLRKLKTLTTWDSEKIFHVRYDDLDMNGHVNNVVYITWALETLDYDFRKKHKLKNIDIYFKHEVRYGQDIISCLSFEKENNTSNHMIKLAQTGEEVCLIRAEFD